MPLCTIWGDANEYVEITMDFANDQIVCEVFNSGISAGTLTLTNIVMERGDTGWVSVAFGASTMTAAAVCGGFDETGLSSDSDSFTLATAPTEVRFSNEAQDEVPQLDFIAVRVTTGTAFDLDQITTSAGLSYSSLQGPAVRGRERDRTRFGRFR